MALFDFQLTADDMQRLDALDRRRRFNDPGEFCQRAFGTFCPIFD
jgi:D-xylose reductase